MKKGLISSILISTLFLSGCFGDIATPIPENEDPRTTAYQANQTFYFTYPSSWKILSKEQIENKAELAIINNLKKSGIFSSNINIVKGEIALENISGYEFGTDILKKHQLKNLPGFKIVSQKKIKVPGSSNNQESLYLIFEREDPSVRYYQIFATRGITSYIITGVIDQRADSFEEERVKNVLKSFLLK